MQGERLMAGLRDPDRAPSSSAMCGLGLMVGCNGSPGRTALPILQRKPHCRACLHAQPAAATCGTYGNVIIRWIPPLVVSAEQIDAALEIFNEAVAAG